MSKRKKSNMTLILVPIIFIIIAAIIAVLMDTFGVAWISQMKVIFSFLFYVYIAGICFVVFFEEKSSERMMSWLLVLILFPGVGLVAYLAFGRSFRKKHRVKQKRVADY